MTTAGEAWGRWSQDVPEFEGKSKVLKILKPLLGSREGATTRSWFADPNGPHLPYPTSNEEIAPDQAALLIAAADALFPIFLTVHLQCNEKEQLVVAVRDAVPDADLGQVREWSKEKYHNRVRKVRDTVISNLANSPSDRVAVLAGQPLAEAVLQSADEAAIQELIVEYIEERSLSQWVASIPDADIQRAVGALTLEVGQVRERALKELTSARRAKRSAERSKGRRRGTAEYATTEFLLPTDIGSFVRGVAVHMASESSFSPEVQILWREWVDRGTEWIDVELRARKVFPGNRRYDLASTETYETISDGVRRFLTRVDLGLASTDAPGLRGWAKTRIKWCIGGYLKDQSGYSPLSGAEGGRDASIVPDSASSAEKRAIVVGMMLSIQSAAESLPGLASDQTVAAMVEWLDTHGVSALSEFEDTVARPDAPAKASKPGGALLVLADACHRDLAAAGMTISRQAARRLFASCLSADPTNLDDLE